MLESDAKSLICPLSMANAWASQFCEGANCLAWEEQLDEVRNNGTLVDHKPKEPPEGICQLIPQKHKRN